MRDSRAVLAERENAEGGMPQRLRHSAALVADLAQLAATVDDIRGERGRIVVEASEEICRHTPCLRRASRAYASR